MHNEQRCTHLVTNASGQSCVTTLKMYTEGAAGSIESGRKSAGCGRKKSCPKNIARPESNISGHRSRHACRMGEYLRSPEADSATYSNPVFGHLWPVLYDKLQVWEGVRQQHGGGSYASAYVNDHGSLLQLMPRKAWKSGEWRQRRPRNSLTSDDGTWDLPGSSSRHSRTEPLQPGFIPWSLQPLEVGKLSVERDVEGCVHGMCAFCRLRGQCGQITIREVARRLEQLVRTIKVPSAPLGK